VPVDVGFVERFYLADGYGSANAGCDVLNPKFSADTGKLGCSASSRFELGSLVGENLRWNTKLFH